MKPPSSIRVLIADDHSSIRRGLTDLLSSTAGFEVVGTAATADEVVGLTRQYLPDVILMDIRIPPEEGAVPGHDEGFIAARRIMAEQKQIKILMITGFNDEVGALNIYRRAQTEAHGYITKGDSDQKVLDAIRHIYRGRTAFRAPLRTPNVKVPLSQKSTLTKRQEEVLFLMAKGLSTVNIAMCLNLSEKTVRTHIRDILKRLNVHSRLEAVQLATKEHPNIPKS